MVDLSCVFYIKYWIAASFMLLIHFTGVAQTQDSILVKEESVREVTETEKARQRINTATWLSVALPGAGQIYNKSYWKAPLVWGGLAASIYFAIDNQRLHKEYTDAIILRTDDDPTTVDKFQGVYSDRYLVEAANFYRQNRDLSIVIALAVYGLQIIDANVDAHLYDFDISDDLSLNLRPDLNSNLINGRFYTGFKLTLSFK